MAVTESVKIVFEVDDKALVSTVQQLQAVGKISQEDAAKFNALSQASKAAGSSLDNASKSAEKFASATKDVAKSTSDVAKSAGELKSVAPSLTSAGQAASSTGEGFISLRTRVREAKEELARLEEKFGEFSPQANEARKRAGELADKMSDLNRQVGLLNPESKIQAFTKLGSGIVGTFQVATGALQAFGAKNEEVQKIAQQLQGALNIVQGIQSIIQLKEAYQDVKAVLGLTTVAENALTTAKQAEVIVTEEAIVANEGFAASLSATGIGAIVVAIGALVGAMILLSNSEKDASKEADKLVEKQKELTSETEKAIKAEEDLAIAKDPTKKAEIEKTRAIREGSTALREQQKEYNRINNQIKNNDALNKDAEERIKALSKSTRESAAIQIQSIRKQIDARNEENKILTESRDLTYATIIQIKNRVTATKNLIDEENKSTDAVNNNAKAEKNKNDIISKNLEIYSQEQKIREFNLELNKLYGASEEDILRQKLFNNQADQESLDAILLKAKGTDQYQQVQNQLNDKIREEILLRKQLENVLEIPLIPLKNQFEEQKNINKELEKTGPIAVKINSQWKGSAQELIDTEEKLKKQQQERIDRAFQIANGITDIYIEAAQRQNEEELASLEDSRQQGLITEKEYQNKVKQLKQKAAEDNKKAQIFQATMAAAQSILSAASGFYLTPYERIAAIAFASAISAINLAKIVATPIPKFKKGTLSVPGYDTGDDSVHAMLRPGEAVIPTEINKEYASAIKAIYTRKVSSKDLNDFVNSRMSVVRDEPVFNFNPVTMDALFKRNIRVSQVSNALNSSTNGTMPTINVKADVDTYALSRAMAKNRQMELLNPDVVAKALAQELAKIDNIRRR